MYENGNLISDERHGLGPINEAHVEYQLLRRYRYSYFIYLLLDRSEKH